MLKTIVFPGLVFFTVLRTYSQQIVTSDLYHFWEAYDRITAIKDSAKQYGYLKTLYLDKASPGLKAIMEVRSYTPAEYIRAINNYPLFWRSIRPNTLRAAQFAKEMQADLEKIKHLYPALKPATIYFTIGAFRTGGTTLRNMVLIGSEIAMADSETVVREFPPQLSHLKAHFAGNPIRHLAFGNTHEYVHTQQKTTIGNTLLAQSVLEGVAEFVAVLATGKASTSPALAYGKANPEQVKEAFSLQLFNSFTGFWLYSNAENEFGTRDLGYYTGYALCEAYYEKTKDKKKAIRTMIELDYNNAKALARFVDQSGYLKEPVAALEKRFRDSQPKVTSIRQLKNGATDVDPTLSQLTIEFSEPMDERFRNFEFGPGGENKLLRLKNFVGFSEDKRSATFEIELQPGRSYELLINSGFRSEKVPALSLQPYLLQFKTAMP